MKSQIGRCGLYIIHLVLYFSATGFVALSVRILNVHHVNGEVIAVRAADPSNI